MGQVLRRATDQWRATGQGQDQDQQVADQDQQVADQDQQVADQDQQVADQRAQNQVYQHLKHWQ
jgi:hypothetical protein